MIGKLIVLEGLDGSGKTTQFELLKKEKIFSDAVFVSFPNYNSHSGKIINEYLAGAIKEDDPFKNAYSTSSFYAIDRYLSFKRDWESELNSGKTIIISRYVTSNAIYQLAKLPERYGGAFDHQRLMDNIAFINWLYDYEHERLGLPWPDAVIFLDMPLEYSQRLLDKRYMDGAGKDLHESNINFMERCEEAAGFVAALDKKRWRRVDCINHDNGEIRSREDLHSEIMKIIKDVINARI